MEEEFVPYEQARDLKELKFDEPCIGQWDGWCSLLLYEGICYNSRFDYDFRHTPIQFAAPTFSQAFKWFRKKHGIHSFIDIYPQPDEPERCWYMLRYFERGEKGKEDYMSGWFINQDKAELACLKKLIEIVKEKK